MDRGGTRRRRRHRGDRPPGPRRQLGADRVVHPSDLPTFGIHQPDHIAPDAVHVVLECSGRKPAMEAGLQQLRHKHVFEWLHDHLAPLSKQLGCDIWTLE